MYLLIVKLYVLITFFNYSYISNFLYQIIKETTNLCDSYVCLIYFVKLFIEKIINISYTIYNMKSIFCSFLLVLSLSKYLNIIRKCLLKALLFNFFMKMHVFNNNYYKNLQLPKTLSFTRVTSFIFA